MNLENAMEENLYQLLSVCIIFNSEVESVLDSRVIWHVKNSTLKKVVSGVKGPEL